MAKQNYRQAKRQKEEARKTRQLQKRQRRSERGAPPAIGSEDAIAAAADAVEPVAEAES